MGFALLDSIIILLVVAFIVTSVFRYFNLPVIVGYLIVGIFVGPHALAWVADSDITRDIAEFGIVFLLFTIGLEFSLAKLLSMKKLVFVYGGMEVLLAILITAIIGKCIGMTLTETIVIGCVVAMSSTAIALKQLKEQLEINTPHGNAALGILLFQDLAVIPVLILIPSLVDVHSYLLLKSLSWALLKGAAAFILILTLGRWVLRPLFFRIAETHSIELFTLTVLLVTLGFAWFTHFLGLSLALGAFLAGMMLGETEFRHQIEAEVRPFRDIFLGLFFISIGMQLNIAVVQYAWVWILLLFFALVIFKFLLITGIGLLLKQAKDTAMQTGIILAQGGEFGFAILSLALTYKLLPNDYAQVILCAILMSMMIAPILIRYNQAIVAKLFPKTFKHTQEGIQEQIKHSSEKLNNHVIICGYGRVGQNVARFLELRNKNYIAFDLDPERVNSARLAGDNVCYADASHPGILQSANINSANVVLISFSDVQETKKIIGLVRQTNKDLPIIVRCHGDEMVTELFEAGASEVIPESYEASLMLASHVLLFMDISNKDIYHLIDNSRKDRYALLRMVFPGEQTLVFEEGMKQGLQAVRLSAEASAVGKTLHDINLASLHVQVNAIRRGQQKLLEGLEQQILQADDVLVLFGDFEQLGLAEDLLLEGCS